MTADEVMTQLFDRRDFFKITGISNPLHTGRSLEMHAGGLNQAYVRAVHFASTEIMVGVLARNPTRDVKDKYPDVQMAVDLSMRWARMQDISSILESRLSSSPETTPGRQALHITSKIIYIQDNRKLSPRKWDRYSTLTSAEQIKTQLFMPEDIEKIIEIQCIDKSRWIVHFQSAEDVVDIHQRMKQNNAIPRGFRVDRFWYYGTKILKEWATKFGKSRDALCTPDPDATFSLFDNLEEAESKLSQGSGTTNVSETAVVSPASQTSLYKDQRASKATQSISANKTEDSIELCASGLTPTDCGDLIELSSNEDYFDCSESFAMDEPPA